MERELEGMEGIFDNCVMKIIGRCVLICRYEVYLLWYFWKSCLKCLYSVVYYVKVVRKFLEIFIE